MIYTLPDGTKIEGPSDPTVEEKAWLTSQKATSQTSPVKDVLKSAWSGLKEGVLRAPFIGGDLGTMAYNLGNKAFNKEFAPARLQSDQVLDIMKEQAGLELHKPETRSGRYANTIANAVGGSVLGGLGAFKLAPALAGAEAGFSSAVTGAGARVLQTPLAQNTVGGAAAEFAGDASRGFDENREQNPLFRLAGGLAGGLGTGIAGRVAAPRQEQMLYEASKGMSPAEWQKAQQVNRELTAAGARSQTIPDTLPTTSTLRGVAQEISNAPGGQALYAKLAGRDEGDIAQLLASAKDQMQKAAVPNVSALRDKPGADQFLADVARSNRTGDMRQILQNAPLTKEPQLQAIVEALKTRARLPANAGTDDAKYAAQASKQVDGIRRRLVDGEMGVNTEALSKVIKSLQNVDSQVSGPAGQVLKNNAAIGAAKEASNALAEQSPAYAQAMQAYAAKSPQADLAALLAANKLKAIPNAGKSSLTQDSLREEIAALISKINPQTASSVQTQMGAADRLSRLKPEMGAQNVEAQYGSTALSALAAPFSTVAHGSNTNMRGRVSEQVANLLANPTAQNYAYLEKLSQSDPALRKMLMNLGNVGGANSAALTQGSE
jgi:hypothetical protein